MWALGFPYVKRISRAQLAAQPELRQGASDQALAQLFHEAIRLKGCVSPNPALASSWPHRDMVSIGG